MDTYKVQQVVYCKINGKNSIVPSKKSDGFQFETGRNLETLHNRI